MSLSVGLKSSTIFISSGNVCMCAGVGNMVCCVTVGTTVFVACELIMGISKEPSDT